MVNKYGTNRSLIIPSFWLPSQVGANILWDDLGEALAFQNITVQPKNLIQMYS
jgi:hypothetical protein